ncbi:MAG: pyridine nucleotide-disulfide oxidoreductase [Proteobacteria bacterium]|nr:pyridine nucleotide-disulfide oxidoreductase [Pseudomonadota bacterium]
MPTLALSYDVCFQDLYTANGIARIDAHFLDWLEKQAPNAHKALITLRKNPISDKNPAYSDFLVTLAPYAARFTEHLFSVPPLQNSLKGLQKLADFRRLFVGKRVLPGLKDGTISPLFDEALDAMDEVDFATRALGADDPDFLARALAHTAWAVTQDKPDKLFTAPQPTDYDHLLDAHETPRGIVACTTHPRTGFDLTHTPLDPRGAFLEASACLYCHKRDKDSCAKGLRTPDGIPQTNPLGEALAGCPLGQKISQMAYLKAQGEPLAALIVACLDNPLLAATGDRICTDCSRACIFQKQTPIDIPALESAIFEEVLHSPWGFEIYSLFTRWSPLSLTRPVPNQASSHTVLVAGMGPSGITMSHHLMNAGHTVVALEGLAVAPVSPDLLTTPIYDVKESLHTPLSQRQVSGFGGVAEYGITVRWDKNRLMLLRLLLERRDAFTLLGSTRLGSQITPQQALDMGFSHVALCLGAGAPHVPDNIDTLPRGVRTASDFLMTLHTGGAYLEDSLSTLTLRLPLYVLGGGLTAVDTATEALAYYPLQVKRFAQRYRQLVEATSKEEANALWTTQEHEEVATFLAHARALEEEDALAKTQERAPNYLPLLIAWGGVHILYRSPLTKAPAYRKGAHELQMALEEGIVVQDQTQLHSLITDAQNSLIGLRVTRGDALEELPAGTLLIASGTLENAQLPRTPDPRISFHGDMDDAYRGSVVGAMASATHGARAVCETLFHQAPTGAQDLAKALKNDTQAYVESLIQLTPTTWEIILFAPSAARAFQPGQFFRLQCAGGPFKTEPLALTGAHVDVETGLLSLIVLDSGASSYLTRFLKQGDAVSLMGPTGTPTPLPHGKKVLLIGGGLGNAVLFSIGKALLERGCQVLYVAGYRSAEHIFKKEDVEASSSQVIWACEEGAAPAPGRPDDVAVTGTVIDAQAAYIRAPHASCLNGAPDFVLTIGSASMMEAVARATRVPFFEKTRALASLNSPMQCMMKGICGACLQPGRDARTRKRYMFFSCTCQDQPLQEIDFVSLKARLTQNILEEKLNSAWVRKVLPHA